MTREEIAAKLKAQFGEAVSDLGGAVDAFVTVRDNGQLLQILRWLKETDGVEMDFLSNQSGTDFLKESRLRVVYHLFSYKHRHDFILKAEVDRAAEAPSLPSATGIWKTANWFEREIFDLFGVAFEGHPDLRRILMPDDWIGHPLRKDYKEPASWHGISTIRESPLDGFVRLDDLKKKVAAEAATPAGAPAAPTPEVTH